MVTNLYKYILCTFIFMIKAMKALSFRNYSLRRLQQATHHMHVILSDSNHVSCCKRRKWQYINMIYKSLNPNEARNHYYSASKMCLSTTTSQSQNDKNEITNSSDELKNINQAESSSLQKQIKDAFLKDETDGILKIAPKMILQMQQQYPSDYAQNLILYSLEAVNNNKGQVASILNAFIASCCSYDKSISPELDKKYAYIAWDIYLSWEGISKKLDLYPDIVTYCVTYSVLHNRIQRYNEDDRLDANDGHIPFFKSTADLILDEARRYSKKLAGSKRRKSLVSLRNNKYDKGRRATDHISSLQELCGLDFDILYEDDDMIIVNKPSGMVCYHNHKTNVGKVKRKSVNKNTKKTEDSDDNDEQQSMLEISDISLEDVLLSKGITLSTLNPDAFGIVHRIDRGTSGCIVLAKNDETHANLLTSFFTRRIEKSYHALIPYHQAGSSNTDLQNMKDFNLEGDITLPVDGRPALSKYKVLKSFRNKAFLIEVETKTGRKHQVRHHCAEGLLRPIFLDPLYHNLKRKRRDESDIYEIPEPIQRRIHPDGYRFYLHAAKINLPSYGIIIEARYPTWWQRSLDDLGRICN